MLNWRTLRFGLLFGLMDAVTLPVVKNVSLGWNKAWMILPVLFYASSPFVFLSALGSESLTIMNLVWDLVSDITVTLIGLFIYREHVSPVKLVGVALSFVSLFLMTYEGNGWNERIAGLFKL